MKVWIFGGSKGIGEAIANKLVAVGHDVLNLARTENAKCRNEYLDLDQPGEDIAFKIHMLLILEGSGIIDKEERDYIIKYGFHCGWRKYWQLSKQGAPDLVIVSGGMGAYIRQDNWRDDTRPDHKCAGINNLIRVNLTSRMWICNEMIKAMRRKRSGTIAIIGSRTSTRGAHALEVYAATHAAMRGYVLSASRHPAKRGVDLGLIELGWTSTPMTANLSPHIKEAIDKELGPMMTADEAANKVLEEVSFLRGGDIVEIGN